MLLSRRGLQRLLGVLWLVDGLLQLQPQMFTGNMINGVMKPILEGQPGFLESIFQFFVNTITQYLTAVNLLIATVQILLGLGFIFLSEERVRQLVVASFIWALIVWFGGEGMSMLFTGTASALTGAPGAVLLYPLIGLAVWPRSPGQRPILAGLESTTDEGFLSRRGLRYALSGFWFFSAFLQLQPYWWESGHISAAIGNMVGAGGLNRALVDPVLIPLVTATATGEVLLNFVLVLVFIALGIGVALPGDSRYLRLSLIASIVASALLWYFAQAFGMILTGMATDFNSGLLLIVMALGAWTRPTTVKSAQGHAVPAPGEAGQHSRSDGSAVGTWR